jgi:hypothetical protein
MTGGRLKRAEIAKSARYFCCTALFWLRPWNSCGIRRNTIQQTRGVMMWKGAVVGAIALTMGMVSFAAAENLGSFEGKQERASASQGPLIKEAHIARLRAALNLTAAQERHWGPVEAALRALARHQARQEASAGFVARMSDKASSVANTAVQLKRLASVARPLIKVLDENQKRSAMSFAQSAGFGHLAQAF